MRINTNLSESINQILSEEERLNLIPIEIKQEVRQRVIVCDKKCNWKGETQCCYNQTYKTCTYYLRADEPIRRLT